MIKKILFIGILLCSLPLLAKGNSHSQSLKESNPSLPAIATLKDMVPPQRVASITAKPLSSTQLNLRWTASESDDVVSYRIYRARDKQFPVIVKTLARKEKDQRFMSTTVNQKKDLQINYDYAVAAIDGAGNVSELSEFYTVRLADGIAPRNPLQLSIKQGEGQLELNWLPAPENDLAGYKVYRKNSDHRKKLQPEPYRLLHNDLIKGTQYIDDQVDPLSSYRYRVAAVDRYGNESKPGRGIAVRTELFDQPIPAPSRLVIKTDKKGYPKLNWQLESKQAALKVRVFRSDGGEFQAVSSLLNNNQFSDTSVIGGKAYKYRLQSLNTLGQHSKDSNTVLWAGRKK